MDDGEVVLLEAILHDLAAIANPYRVDALDVLVVEVAPVLLVLQQAVAMVLQRGDDGFAIQLARPPHGSGPLPDDAVGRRPGAPGEGLMKGDMTRHMVARSR